MTTEQKQNFIKLNYIKCVLFLLLLNLQDIFVKNALLKTPSQISK